MRNNAKVTIIILVLTLLSLVSIPTAAFACPKTAVGAVYTMTNDRDKNEVIQFDRATDGTLSNPRAFSTDGTGTGSGLGNQGGLVLTKDRRFLLVVNAGSDEISVFKVKREHLLLTDNVGSGGDMPISVTVHKNLVYVLNAGGTGNISGFILGKRGTLSPIKGSTRPLSGGAVQPAQVAFNPSGSTLVVTEKATNKIDLYSVNNDGLASGPTTFNSVGTTPFGFAFDRRGHLIVSEAGTGALSSYALEDAEGLEPISSSVLTRQTAACWVVISQNGRFAYTTNTGSDSISSFTIGPDGTLTLLEQVAAMPGDSPIDMALSKDGRFLYALNSQSDDIAGFRVNADGSLTRVETTTVSELAPDANGLAAR